MNAKQGTIDQQMQKSAKSKANGKDMVAMKSPDITRMFENYKMQIEQALPKHITAERVIQMAVTLCSKNPKLKECTPASFVGAVMQASILGLRPVDSLGQCYFVPYRNNRAGITEIQFQIGYKGYIELARRSGQIMSIHAECVFDDDEFSYQLGLHPDLKHIPCDDCERDNMADLTHVYAVVHYKDGGYNFVVLTRNQIEKLRLRNPMQGAQPAGAWKTDYDKMAKAKAIKQLATYMPLSDEMQSATVSDEAVLTPQSFANDMSGELLGDHQYPAETAEAEDVTDSETQNEKSDE